MSNMPKQILLGSGIFRSHLVLYIVAAVVVIAVVAFLLILIIWRRRKSRKVINVDVADDEAGGDEADADEVVGGEWSKDNYEAIIKRVKQVRKKYKSILFASVDTVALPVTIPVNTAIGLAKEKQRCLLIDLDLKRDAVAKVFGLDAEQSSLRARSVQTDFENLWLWPGHKFSQSKQMNIAEIVVKALEKFDLVLINAPALISNLDRKQIISAAQAAFVCIKDASERKRLDELIKPSNCKIIGQINTQ